MGFDIQQWLSCSLAHAWLPQLNYVLFPEGLHVSSSISDDSFRTDPHARSQPFSHRTFSSSVFSFRPPINLVHESCGIREFVFCLDQIGIIENVLDVDVPDVFQELSAHSVASAPGGRSISVSASKILVFSTHSSTSSGGHLSRWPPITTYHIRQHIQLFCAHRLFFKPLPSLLSPSSSLSLGRVIFHNSIDAFIDIFPVDFLFGKKISHHS